MAPVLLGALEQVFGYGTGCYSPRRFVLAGGRLVDTSRDNTLFPDSDEVGTLGPLARHLVDELACVASWLDAEAGRVRLVHCDGELASCLPPILRVKPARATAESRS